jgi:tyrosine decarboxylase / aspartate 1-decarboxylase
MVLDGDSLRILARALEKLDAGFSQLPPFEPQPAGDRLEEVLAALAGRLQDNYPYFHPLYAGQMLKPPHPVARLAYALALYLNPNNHALDGGRATSQLEKEAVGEIAAVFGWRNCLGHLCGGGTMANLEALWVSGLLDPRGAIAASEQAHYTHSRISGVLRLPFETLRCDERGRLDPQALEKRAARGGLGTVVATLGTTATGAVDPLPEILALREKFGFRVHVDAAYGGYFALASNLDRNAEQSLARAGEADSIVIDPHKHGLQPYGCGCVLFRDPAVGRLYKHDSPYTYFSSAELHLGEISLECSRPGAAAAALWATQKLLPLERGGDFARGLERGREAALAFHRAIGGGSLFDAAFPPELDILCFLPRGDSATRVSARSRRIFEAAAKENLHLALAELPLKFWPHLAPERGRATVTCLRSVLMKPDHLDWIGRILAALGRAAEAAAAD